MRALASRMAPPAMVIPRATAATSRSASEVPEIEWPVCAVHGGHPGHIWHGEDPADLIKKVAWWRCTNTGHPLAPVGQLTGENAKTLRP
jgi:hypothetical protein